MKDLKVTLSLDEVNVILKALGEMPFSQVHELIFRIQNQASQQLKDPVDTTAGAIDVDDEQ